MRILRNFMNLIVLCTISILNCLYSAVSHTVEFCLSKFDSTVEFCVSKVVAIGHGLKRSAHKVFVSGLTFHMPSCHGFVSMRRSLDASA